MLGAISLHHLPLSLARDCARWEVAVGYAMQRPATCFRAVSPIARLVHSEPRFINLISELNHDKSVRTNTRCLRKLNSPLYEVKEKYDGFEQSVYSNFSQITLYNMKCVLFIKVYVFDVFCGRKNESADVELAHTGKNLNQVTCFNQDLNPDPLVSQSDMLTVTSPRCTTSDNADEMSPGSSTERYLAFARIGLRNSGKNLNQYHRIPVVEGGSKRCFRFSTVNPKKFDPDKCKFPFFREILNITEPQKFLKCAGPCGLRYHLDCLNVGEAEYDIYMQSGSYIFKCKKCVSAMKSTQGDNTPVRPTAPGEKKVISPTKKVVSPSRDLNLPSLPSVDSLSFQVETVRLNSVNILDTVSDILEYVKSLQKEMIELKNENAALKIQVAEIFAKTNSNVLTKKGNVPSESMQYESVQAKGPRKSYAELANENSILNVQMAEMLSKGCCPPKSSHSISPMGQSNDPIKKSYSKVVSVNKAADNLHTCNSDASATSKSVSTTPPANDRHNNIELYQANASTSANVSDGFQLVTRKKYKKREPKVGTLAMSSIEMAPERIKTKSLFVSRFSSKVNTNSIEDSLKNQLQLRSLVVTKLKTKYLSYSSFHITVDVRDFDSINKPEVWPAGCLIAPFYGKLKPEQHFDSQGNAS
ncbi:hypothetical protein ANN_15419 [Periplaneta americana]|uniref:Zinc finger PHD-type domain-containing protein n=1 Tax=Periplaneta americana TaxID=6978 RepID=A0ABQ8SHN1_PERAM|nr:hypothetical protein ANN_15419 [Periplaneta americana]